MRRGLNRLFVSFAVCWYVSAGFLLWPMWAHPNIEVPLGQLEADQHPPDTGAAADPWAGLHTTPVAPQKGDPWAGIHGTPVAPTDADPWEAAGIRGTPVAQPSAQSAATPENFDPDAFMAARHPAAKTPGSAQNAAPVAPMPPTSMINHLKGVRPVYPIRLTVAFVLMPLVIYGLALAGIWVVRGFQPNPQIGTSVPGGAKVNGPDQSASAG